MDGSAPRAALIGLTVAFLVSGCLALEPEPPSAPATSTPTASLSPAPVEPDESPSASPTTATQPTPTIEPATAAGPPFPVPAPGTTLVDHADIFSTATEEAAMSRISEIDGNHDVSVVVYTQFKPGSTYASTGSDAKALKLQWRLVNGLVLMWNTTKADCEAGAGGNGQIQLYADSRFSATHLSALKRQKIFDDLMTPFLLECNEDDALLAALDGIADEMRTPTPSAGPSDSPTSNKDACGDDAFKLSGFSWDGPYEWSFQESSVPDGLDSTDALDVLTRSADNITSGFNDCGLPDRIDATATYVGTTTEPPCDARLADGFNTLGFADLPDRDADLLAYVCPYGGWRDVVEADIVINADIPWALSERACVGWQELLEATMTHEFGHVFGLDHVSERQHGVLTMSPSSNGPCSATEITLGLGDILGLEELY